ncbi:hypothetical protein ACLOJK_029575 [Asimina triloba]
MHLFIGYSDSVADVGIAVVRCGRDTPTSTLPTCGMAGSWQRASEAVASGSGQRGRTGGGFASIVGQHGQTIFAVLWVRSRQFRDRLDLVDMMDGMDLLVRCLLVPKMTTDGFGKMNGKMGP